MKIIFSQKFLIIASLFLLPAITEAQDLIQQVNDGIMHLKNSDRQLDKLGKLIVSKSEEVRQKDQEIDIVEGEMRALEKERPDRFNSDPQVLGNFNRKVNALNIKNIQLYSERGILITQGGTLENDMKLLAEQLDQQKTSLIGLLRPYATCAEKLYSDPSIEEIEKCWSCYLKGECAVISELKPSIPDLSIPKHGAPELFETFRKEQVKRIDEAKASIIVKEKPKAAAKKISVNEAPPQKTIVRKAWDDVIKYLQEKVQGRFRVRTPSFLMTVRD